MNNSSVAALLSSAENFAVLIVCAVANWLMALISTLPEVLVKDETNFTLSEEEVPLKLLKMIATNIRIWF